MTLPCIRRLSAALVVASAAIVALAFASPEPALAHAALIAADPAEGVIVAEKPDALSLTFNEPVSPLVLKLVAPDGSVSELAGSRVEGPTLVVPTPAEMPAGTYVLSWRVVSLDGHPVGGTVAFSVGHAGARPSPGGAATAEGPVRAALWLARVALYAGLFLGVGASLYRALIAPLPAASRSFALTVSLAGLLAAATSVGLQGLDALDAPLGAFLHPAVWEAGFATTYGTTATLAIVALLAALVALTIEHARPAALLACIATACVGLALAASGHASTAPPQWLTRPAVFLHAVAIVFWAGALLPLGLTLRGGGEGAALALTRFSRLIPLAILPLVLSGLALAFVQLGTLSALNGTAYGRVLIAKLAVLVVLFALASWNRWRLTEKAEAADPDAVRGLVRSIAVEIVLVVAILGIVALWRFTPPPRALAEAAFPVAQAHLHGEKAMAHLSIAPGRVGTAAASIAIMAEGAEPIEPSEVTLALLKPGSGLEAITRPASRMSDGTWRVDALTVPLPGAWTARVEILVGDYERLRLEGSVEIAP